MKSVQNIISLYHTGFLTCLVLCILSLICSVVMFIRFNIPKIISDKTGRELKKSMKVIEEKNARTGTLRSSGALTGRMRGRSQSFSGPNLSAYQGQSGASAQQNQGQAVTPVQQNQGQNGMPVQGGVPAGESCSRIVPPPQAEPAAGTDILTPETDILQMSGGMIKMTGGGIDTASAVVLKEDIPAGFKVTKRIVIIHTSENIEI